VKQYGIGKPALYVDDLRERMQSMLLGEIATLLANSGAKSVMDANRLLSDLEGAALSKLNDQFEAIGLRIKAFESKPFTAKDASLDELSNYISAEALERIERLERLNIARDAANNQSLGGALAGAGVGLGVGQQIGAAMGMTDPNANSQLQQQLQQQQLMMQQMMMQMMQNQQQAQAAPQPVEPAATEANATPQTRAEVQAILDGLDVKLMNGEISEAIYTKMVAKWEARLAEL
jgi:membrane protease subunit (stomatin/prohibitin family)